MRADVLESRALLADGAASSRRSRRARFALPPFRRRRFWIDSGSQLPITVLAVGACLFFVVLFNAAMLETTTARRQQIAAASPQLEEGLRQEDESLHRYLIVLSGVFLLCVVGGVVALTQRSAGPVHRIRAHMERLTAGELDQSVVLRQRDHFQGLAHSFNALAASLRERTARDADELEQFSAAAESCSTPAEVLALAARLRERSRQKRLALASGPSPS